MQKKQFNEAWKVYNAYVSKMFGGVAKCKHCGKNFISDEAADHMKKQHPLYATELLWLILQRLEYENNQHTV